MQDLVKDEDAPAWKCWLAQVALIRFVTRHSYVRGTDGACPTPSTPLHAAHTCLLSPKPYYYYYCPGEVLTELNNAFLKAFEAMEEWQDGGFPKPKFQPADHLAESLDEFAPPRGYWCMSFEGYLKILKPMFKMCNWKAAPTTVAKHWHIKSVMHYRDPQRGSWYTNNVYPTSDFSTNMELLAKQSALIAALVKRGKAPHVARALKKVVRGPVELRRGDWMVVRQVGKPSLACRVDSMMECMPHGGRFSAVRLWCAGVPVTDDPVTGDMRAELNPTPPQLPHKL